MIRSLSRRRLLATALAVLPPVLAACAPPAPTPPAAPTSPPAPTAPAAPAPTSTGSAATPATAPSAPTTAPPAAPTAAPALASPAPASAGGVAPTGGKVVWANWAVDAGSRARLDEQRAGFEAAYPGVTLDLQNTPVSEYVPKLLATFAADTAPDVFRLNTEQLPVFAGRGQLADLDAHFARAADAWVRRPDLKPGLVERFRLARGLVGLPYGGDMDALFVNRTLFQAEGAPPPPLKYEDPDWTYDRLLDLARRLAKRRPDGGMSQFGIDVGGYRYEGHVENAGGSWFTPDGKTFAGHLPPAVAAIDWLAGLRLKHGVSAAPGTDEARSLNFPSGKLAMSWSGVSQASNRLADVGDRFDWDVTPVPRWGANPLVVKSGFSALSLNARGKALDRGWALLHWVTGPVGSLPDVETGWSVPVFSSLDARYFARFQGRAKNLIPALEGPKYPSKFPVWTNPNYAEAWRRVQVALDLVFQGKGTAGDQLAAARPEIDAILAQPEKP
jgi:ABC-type glycerol-3-phosphate transport system substrate-binding protein